MGEHVVDPTVIQPIVFRNVDHDMPRELVVRFKYVSQLQADWVRGRYLRYDSVECEE
jgi:hypothetical protein